MTDLEALLARASRAFGGRKPSEVAADYRAIVGPTRSDDVLVQGALEALRNGTRPTPLQLAALEHAIRVFRPAIASRGGHFKKLADEHRAAFPVWDAFAAGVQPHLYAIGRIDRGPMAPSSVPENVGTGFLIAGGVLVTNRHVLEVLSLGAMALEPGMAIVNFRQEEDTADGEDPVTIVGVLAIHPTLDLVLLEVEVLPASPDRKPLTLDPAPPRVGQGVVAIGYPFSDAERNPLFVSAALEGVFGVKRASPGEVIELGDGVFHHDASTLGGNSGSPMLDMATARVVGVHFHGGFAVRNTAVTAAALVAFATPFLPGV